MTAVAEVSPETAQLTAARKHLQHCRRAENLAFDVYMLAMAATSVAYESERNAFHAWHLAKTPATP